MRFPDYEYIDVRRKCYGDDEVGTMQFIPVCQKCGRFVKADDHVTTRGDGELVKKPNATCSKCGRVEMIFEGYF